MNSIPQRPAGLVAVVVITAVFAFLGLIICGFALVLAPAADAEGWVVLLMLACFGLSVLEAVAAYGLWSFQNWALGMAKFVFVADIVISGLGMFIDTSSANVIVSLVSIALLIWMLSYISSADIVALYGSSTSDRADRQPRESGTDLKPRDRHRG